MTIKFCGAARTVTGSSHLLTLDNGYKILLDCGLYQGNEEDFDDFNVEWLFEPKDVDCVILSHAHIDHSGRLPKLVKDGFKGTIYGTPATRDLCAIMLLDSAFIQEKDAEYQNKKQQRKGDKRVEPLYTADDVADTMEQFVAVPYGYKFDELPGANFTFRDAGHILGSASVTLDLESKQGERMVLGFTGDIGRPNRPILRDPVPMPQSDYIISESTYGDRQHESNPDARDHFLRIITRTCVDQKGKVIIPAFSIGRTQELIYMLDQLETDGKLPKGIPVFVDSPLAINATDIFRAHPDCYDRQILQYMQQDPNPFGFGNLHYVRKAEHSKKINDLDGPAIIISASGMANAGRVRHHLNNNIEDGRNTILIVGYSAPQTTGGHLRTNPETVKIFGQEKQVKASIEIMDSFSAHGDYDEMLAFLSNQDRKRVRKTFLVHGDEEAAESFQQKLKQSGLDKVEIPALGQEYKL